MAAGLKVPEMALRVCVVPLALASLWEMATNAQADDTYGEVKFSDLSGFSYLVGINAVTAAYAVASILLSSFKPLARYDWVILVMDQRASVAGLRNFPVKRTCTGRRGIKFLGSAGHRRDCSALRRLLRHRICRSFPAAQRPLQHGGHEEDWRPHQHHRRRRWWFTVRGYRQSHPRASAYLLVTSASAAAELLQLARRGDREVSWGEVCSYFGRFCGKATVSLALHAAALACFVALSLVSAFRVFSRCHPPDGQPKHAQEEEQGRYHG